MDERTTLILVFLVGGFFCFVGAALIVGFRAAKDWLTWRDEHGKRVAWALMLIAIGFLICFVVCTLKM